MQDIVIYEEAGRKGDTVHADAGLTSMDSILKSYLIVLRLCQFLTFHAFLALSVSSVRLKSIKYFPGPAGKGREDWPNSHHLLFNDEP